LKFCSCTGYIKLLTVSFLFPTDNLTNNTLGKNYCSHICCSDVQAW